jgi:hypothetical protein
VVKGGGASGGAPSLALLPWGESHVDGFMAQSCCCCAHCAWCTGVCFPRGHQCEAKQLICTCSLVSASEGKAEPKELAWSSAVLKDRFTAMELKHRSPVLNTALTFAFCQRHFLPKIATVLSDQTCGRHIQKDKVCGA